MQNEQPKIIAGTYKILGEIGSGGAGIIYIAEHARLNKKIVLKADKRNIFTSTDTLRREVEALKNLNHGYIPQVYDFVVENDVAYTVMDFIEGESLDKILKTEKKFEQANIVKIAIQLLQALEYLHSRPPYGILHSDIKPANIMMKPDGDICLIDFNIALTLGAEGAVAVGRSFGYASPEHYLLSGDEDEKTKAWSAITASIPYKTISSSDNTQMLLNTETLTNFADQTLTEFSGDEGLNSKSKSTTSKNTTKKTRRDSDYSGKKILLDVRSDIYGVGAVLYHLMTGNRPEKFAQDIKPIPTGKYSRAFINIINKAISPRPDDRFQSASEMLDAIFALKRNDERSVKYRRRVIATSTFLGVMLIFGVSLMFLGIKQDEALKNSQLLAQRSNIAYENGDVDLAVKLALESLPKKSLLSSPATAQSQRALSNALGVYNLADSFKPFGSYELDSQPLKVVLSDNGKYALVFYMGYLDIVNVEKLKKTTTLETQKSALIDGVFISETKFLFTGADGLCLFDIESNKKDWIADASTKITISADGKYVASLFKDNDFATVYESLTGKFVNKVSFQGKRQFVPQNDVFAIPEGNALSLSSDGAYLAVSFDDGSFDLYHVENGEKLEIITADMEFSEFESGFYENYLAFSASAKDRSVFAIIDLNTMEQTGGFDSRNRFSTFTDERGIFIQTENLLVKIDPQSGEQQSVVNTSEHIEKYSMSKTHTLVSDSKSITIYDQFANEIKKFKNTFGKLMVDIKGSKLAIGSLDSNHLIFMNYDESEEADLFSYDPKYIHDEARIISEEFGFMLYNYETFAIFNREGKVQKEFLIPNAKALYDQQFRRTDGNVYLETIYNDGKIIAYNAFDGEILFEKQGEKPDKTLDEVFYTDKFKIEAPLHGNAMIYHKNTGRLVKEIQEDAYLTYITEIGDYFVAQFMTADGYYYGLLLDSNCEVLADLPYLCDVYNGDLIFDYRTGDLRRSKIYDLQELLEFVELR